MTAPEIVNFGFSFDDKNLICVVREDQNKKSVFHKWPLSISEMAAKICKYLKTI